MGNDKYWTRRMRRRSLLTGAAGLTAGAAGLALVGCGDDSGGASAPSGASVTPAASASPRPAASSTNPDADIPKDGIYNLRQPNIYASMNPYKGLDSGALWGYTVFDHLWGTPQDTGKPVLMLANHMEQPDPLHITFKFPEVFFHDKKPVNGRAVKASDIKASFETAARQTTISQTSWWTQSFSHIETPDDSTVTIVLNMPDAWTFSSVNGASPISSSIIPEEILDNIDFMDTDVIGSGRFQFDSAQNGATNFKLSAFPKWRVPGEPWLAGLQYKLIQEQAAADAALLAGEIDSLLMVNKLERDQLTQQMGKKLDVASEQTTSIWTLITRADGNFADPRVRQAISEALDRDQFIKLMYQGDAIQSGPVPAAFKSYSLSDIDLKKTWTKFNVADARALLGAAGFDTSQEYELKYYTPGDQPAAFAQIVQKQLLDNLGIKIKLVGEDFGKWLAQSLYGGDFNGFISFPSIAYDDPVTYIAQWQNPNGGRPNWAHFNNDEINGMITKQQTILDDNERQQALIDLQKKGWEVGVPYLDVHSPTASTGYWWYLKNYQTNHGLFDNYWARTYIDKSNPPS